MIIEVTDVKYKGFRIVHADDNGWKIVLRDDEIMFPNFVAAQGAVDEFILKVVPKYKGKQK